MNINAYVNNTKISNELQNNSAKVENKGTNFLDTLKEKLDDVNDKQIEADNITDQFVKGEEEDVHKVMLSAQEAKLSLELAVQIRNKIVEAYQEFNRMQI